MEQVKNFVSRKSYEYSPVGQEADDYNRHDHDDNGDNGESQPQTKPRSWFHRYRSALFGGLTTVVIVAIVYAAITLRGTGLRAAHCDSPDQGFQCRTDISHSWGQYSPFYKVPSDLDPEIPEGCEVTFAQVLSRHGARDPTQHKTVEYSDLIDRIHAEVTKYSKDYHFIKGYRYNLGADQLSDFGRQQLINSGTAFYRRYRDLAAYKSPFVRSAGQERVVESAQKWTDGFHDSRLHDKATEESDKYPYDILILPERDDFNNTLSDDVCRAFDEVEDPSEEAQTTWRDIFIPPIADRVKQNLVSANISTEDVVRLMEICPFETVANKGGRISPFCDLFTAEEWKGYEYYQSLGKWYGYGDGRPLGPTRGVGFVNELIARLTGKPVEDHTSTNSTLDGSPSTFPLGHVLYADFSHDNDMASIFAALGLYNRTEPLPFDTRQGPEETLGYAASWSVPFASRLYVEKMRCGEAKHDEGSDELVRILVNDRVMALQNCDADELGRCKLDAFVESLSFARSGGHWDECFASSETQAGVIS